LQANEFNPPGIVLERMRANTRSMVVGIGLLLIGLGAVIFGVVLLVKLLHG
jgi:hypothetical protein